MSLFNTIASWLGLSEPPFPKLGSGVYDCYGCADCVYPDGLDYAYTDGGFVDYARLFGLVDDEPKKFVPSRRHGLGYVKTLTGKGDTEQQCY